MNHLKKFFYSLWGSRFEATIVDISEDGALKKRTKIQKPNQINWAVLKMGLYQTNPKTKNIFILPNFGKPEIIGSIFFSS